MLFSGKGGTLPVVWVGTRVSVSQSVAYKRLAHARGLAPIY